MTIYCCKLHTELDKILFYFIDTATHVSCLKLEYVHE